VEIFVKDLIQFYNSKREKKSLSSGFFVTAAGMVQQNDEIEPLDDRTTMNLVWCSECSASDVLAASPVCPSALGHLYFSFVLQLLLHLLTESGAAKFHAQAHFPT
jgi:hypothetical protein